MAWIILTRTDFEGKCVVWCVKCCCKLLYLIILISASLLNITNIMANSNRQLSIETVAQQVMETMKEEYYDDIFGVSGTSESDLSDKDDPTCVPALKTCYSDNEALIGSLYSTDYELESKEEETLPDLSPAAPERNIWSGKDETFWSSWSFPEGRFRTRNVICTKIHTVQSSEIYTPKDAFQYFLSDNIIEKILLCTNLQGRLEAIQWSAVQKEEFLAFIGVLLLEGIEKIRFGHTSIILEPETKSYLPRCILCK